MSVYSVLQSTVRLVWSRRPDQTFPPHTYRHPALLCLLLCAGLATPAASQSFSIYATNCSFPSWGSYDYTKNGKRIEDTAIDEVSTSDLSGAVFCYAVVADRNVDKLTEFTVKITSNIDGNYLSPKGEVRDVIPTGRGFVQGAIQVGCREVGCQTDGATLKDGSPSLGNYESRGGSVTLQVIDGQGNSSSTTVLVNMGRPATATLSSLRNNIFNGENEEVTIFWTRPVTGFTDSDLSITGGAVCPDFEVRTKSSPWM